MSVIIPTMMPMIPQSEPGHDCPLCPRLVQLRETLRAQHPDWFNAPVPSFGAADARLLVAGLAPGVRGANRTGRPFTGDYAGELLYATLLQYGFASGRFEARPDDGLTLIDCRISNAVRCVPPGNKPIPAEIATCRQFFVGTLKTMPNVRAIVVLGRIAHDTVLSALDVKRSYFPFAHGATHDVVWNERVLRLFDSYHCSRLNTNTGVLTPDMFQKVFAGIREYLD